MGIQSGRAGATGAILAVALATLSGCAAPYPNPLDQDSPAEAAPAIAETVADTLENPEYRRVGVTHGYEIYIARGTLGDSVQNCVLWQSVPTQTDGTPASVGTMSCASGSVPVLLDAPEHLSVRYDPNGAAPERTTPGWTRLSPFVEVRIRKDAADAEDHSAT